MTHFSTETLSGLTQWRSATKTKSIRAKLVTELIDREVLPFVRLDTLEGFAEIGAHNYLCLGVAEEPWQQKPEKLFSAYTVEKQLADGWLVMSPKPGNAVEVIQVWDEKFSISALWGTPAVIDPNIGTEHIQTGEMGDYIVRDPNNHKDVWIVKREIFDSTYEIKS